ncbi:MAG: tetratricopeptide repeat protein [Candidatus Latescibacterota bacterium]|jgi:tetratricopeptide (TPR) repeat protein
MFNLARGKGTLGALLSCGLALFLYAHTLEYDFSYDDRGILLENENLRQLDWSRLMWESYWQGQGDGLYRPLTMLSYGVSFLLSGKPLVFHGFNIALHAINTLLLYLFICRYRGVERGLWSALLFAANPLLSESVASIVGRAELLSFTLGIAGWITWNFAREKKDRGWWLLAASASLLLSQLAKENGIVFAIAVAGSVWQQEKRLSYSLLLPLSASLSGLLLKYWAIGSLKPSVIGFIDNPLAYADASVRIANGLGIYARYVAKLIFPWPLSVDYSFDQIPIIQPWYATDHLMVSALLLSSGFFFLRWSIISQFRLQWFVAVAASLFLVSSIPVASSTIFAERLLYLPVAGFSLLLSLFLSTVKVQFERVILLSVVLIFSVLTLDRIPVWENDTELFSNAVLSSPRSARSYYGLGVSLHREGEWEDALAAYNHALSIYPQYADAQYNKAALLLGRGKYTDAYNAYGQVVAINPGYVKAKRALALIQIERGEVEQGLDRLRFLISEREEADEAFKILVGVLVNLGRTNEAERVLLEGLKAEPNNTILLALLQQIQIRELKD